MRRKIARVFGVTLLLLSFFFLWGSKEIPVKAADIAENEKAEYEAETEYEETEAGDVRTYMEEKLEFDDINRELEGLFPDEKLDFGETVLQILSGDLSVSADLLKRLCADQLTYAFQVNRESLIHMLLIALIAAIFTKFADVFDSRQISDISFYILYMLMIALCLNAFQSAAEWTEDGIRLLADFMQALCPVYFLAVSLAKGSVTAAAFYNLILLLIFLIELLIIGFLLPVIHIYMMMKVLNYLSEEEYLSRFTELIETVVSWTLKTMLACVIGLNTIQGLIMPAVDSVKRSAVARGVEAIPGIGDAVSGTAEVILGTAVVVKNGVGVAGAVICFALCLAPLIQIGVMVLFYKLAAALVQPVADKRLTGCIGGMADGCQLLMRMIFTAGILFLITIAIVAATTSSV